MDDGIFRSIWAAFVLVTAQEHFQLIAAFIALVVMDLVTKWFALSRSCLIHDGVENPSLWEAITHVGTARREGYIKSELLRKRFLPKMAAYMLTTGSAVLIDWMMINIHAPVVWVTLCVGYLAAGEMFSIMENLQEAGVDGAGKLGELIKKKGNL